MSFNILHIDSSPRGGDSVTRKLTAQIVDKLGTSHEDATVT